MRECEKEINWEREGFTMNDDKKNPQGQVEEMIAKCQMDKELKPITRLVPLLVHDYLTKPQSQRAKVSL